MGTGPNYGIVQPALDGRAVGGAFDGYAPAPGRSDELVLGRVELAEGAHTVTFTVQGKADASGGLFAGVDYLELEP